MANTHSLVPSLWDETNKLLSFDSLHKQIDRLFSEFGQTFGVPSGVTKDGSFDFVPSAELTDGDKEVVVRVELPGVEVKDVDIAVIERTIDISGEKRSETEHRDGDYYRTERSFGAFRRSFTLPFSIAADKVDAKFEKGVLTVKITKPAEAQSRAKKIAIYS